MEKVLFLIFSVLCVIIFKYSTYRLAQDSGLSTKIALLPFGGIYTLIDKQFDTICYDRDWYIPAKVYNAIVIIVTLALSCIVIRFYKYSPIVLGLIAYYVYKYDLENDQNQYKLFIKYGMRAIAGLTFGTMFLIYGAAIICATMVFYFAIAVFIHVATGGLGTMDDI